MKSRPTNQTVHQTGQFTSAILGKYGFWRHDYLGLLSLIFKGHPGWKQLTRNSAPSVHKEWLIKLQLQLQSLKHPDSYHLSTKKEIIHRLEQQITRLGHNRQFTTAGKHQSSNVTMVQTSRSGDMWEYSTGLIMQAPLHPDQRELKLIKRAATQAANVEPEAAEIYNTRINKDNPETTERDHTQNNPNKQNPLVDEPSHQPGLSAEQNEAVGNRKDRALQQTAGILKWESDAESRSTVPSIKWSNRPGIEISLWGLQGIESKQGVGRIGRALRNMELEPIRRTLSKVQERVIRDAEQIFHRHQVLLQEPKKPGSLANTSTEPASNERRNNKQGMAEQDFIKQSISNQSINSNNQNKQIINKQIINRQIINSQSDIQQNVGKLESNPVSSVKLHSQDQDPTGRMEHAESKPDNSRLNHSKGNAKQSARSKKRDGITQNIALESQTLTPLHIKQSRLEINVVPRDRSLLQQSGRLIPFSLTHIQKNEGSPILQRIAAVFADSTGLAARRISGHQHRQVVQFYQSHTNSSSRIMQHSQRLINVFEGSDRKLGANRADESAGTLLASSSFQKVIDINAVDSISQPRIQRRSNLRSKDRAALQDQALRDRSFKDFSEKSEPSPGHFSLQAEMTSLHKAILRRNAHASLNNMHITQYVESAMELIQPLLQRRNGSSPAGTGSQQEFSSVLPMQRSRQSAAVGSEVPELIAEGNSAEIRQRAAPSARQFRSHSSLQPIKSRMAAEEAGNAHVEPARYIPVQRISLKWGLSPFTFGASPPAQRIFRKQSEAQMLMQEPINEYLRKHQKRKETYHRKSDELAMSQSELSGQVQPSTEVDITPNLASGTVIRFGRPDDKLALRIKAKEDAAPGGTSSQKPTQIQSVKYNELANLSFYQAKRRNPPKVIFSQPISSIITNYPNYESAKQFTAHFQKPSARMGSRRPKDWQKEQQTNLTQVIRASQVTKASQTVRAASIDRGLYHKQAMEKSMAPTAPLYPKHISSTEPKADYKAILSEHADLSLVAGSSNRRMVSSQQTHREWPSTKSADRQTNTASTSSIQKRNKPNMGATRQRSISQSALNSPKVLPRVGAISNARSQSETDDLSQAPVQMLLNYVQDNQTILEHKPGSDASASELSNQPLEMDWLRLNQAEEPISTETRPVEQPAPQLDLDQLKDLVKKLPQFDIKKIADRVYREIEKKIQFDRQRRGI